MLKKRKKYIWIMTILSIVLAGSVLMSSILFSKAATTGTANVKIYLNGGTVAGYTDGGIKQGTSGTSISIPAPPSKTGYTFKGWLQQGNFGIGPWGRPVWSDGEFVSRPATDICAKYFYPVSTTVVKIAKPADCQTKISPDVVRITIKEDGKYSGVDDYVSLIWSSEMNVLANSNIKCMMYAKIPPGYALSPATSGATNPGTLLLNGTDYYRGTGEFQYYESTWFNGNGPQGYGLFAIKKLDKSLLDPSASNPCYIDIGYYNYTKCDGSAGTGLGNGTGSYKFDFTSSSSYIQDNLTAIFDPNVYNIIYDANGGINPPNSQSYGYNTSKTLALTGTIPVKAGFTFQGWARTPDATVPEIQPGQSWACNIMQDTTLYALWKFSACNLESPKTLILGSDGKASFNIKAPLASGKIDVVAPNSLIFKQTNKPDVNGFLTLSSTSLSSTVPVIQGQIQVTGLTAGSWISQFNIKYTFVP